MPVRDEIEMAMSFIVAKHVTEGRYYKLRAEFKGMYVGSSTCDAADETEAAEGFESLDEWALFAPFLITFVCTSTGLVVYFVCGYAIDDIHALAELALHADEKYELSEDSKLHSDMLKCTVPQLRARAGAAGVSEDGASASCFCLHLHSVRTLF
jgi:hypothetical protein